VLGPERLLDANADAGGLEGICDADLDGNRIAVAGGLEGICDADLDGNRIAVAVAAVRVPDADTATDWRAMIE
jgi:hypothetical protein